ncbi:MAG: SAM-dependent chlorinase/fluorinase [Ignavibacteria bacterium]|nr:SAM-dependent chlorinase/fluorinase [Ignavibacteria bacterium]
MKRNIALLTDFGLDDHYVGVMKGTILTINPDVNIIDISHSVAPGNIRQAAFLLMVSIKYFPPKTIFIAVVDPGVGSNRNPLCIQTETFYFVGPDNGVFSYALTNFKSIKAYRITTEKYFLENVSKTFHGRDIFAPVAGHISKDVDVSEFGEQLPVDKLAKLPPLKTKWDAFGNLIGEVIHIDRFGNIVTSLSSRALGLNMHNILKQDLKWQFEIGHTKIRNLSTTYSDVNEGNLVAYIGSSDFLEFAIRNGNAAKEIGAYIGQPICARKVGIYEQFI